MNVPGYHIKTEKGLDPDKFLETYFPGFDAFAVSKQAEQLLAPMATTPLQREWQFSDHHRVLPFGCSPKMPLTNKPACR